MGDKRNYAALEWVIGEIGETLNDARQALEAFVEDPRDTARIRFCLTHIHQVHGSLQMVEFHGASLFAEEMEALAESILQANVVNEKEAQEVLMRSLLQLPHYLEQVKTYQDDHPGIVLPLLNDIRAVRKQSYLSETNLFNPDLSSLGTLRGERHSILSEGQKIRQVMSKLREMYKYAAASVLRGIKIDENLAFIDKVFVRLEGLARGTRSHPVWQVVASLTEALVRDDVELSVAVRGLLRQIDREMRILEEHCPQALDAKPNESLLRNMLFYVACAEPGGRRVEQIKNQFDLDNALIGSSGKPDRRSGLAVAPEPEAIVAVITALHDELNTAKHLMNLAISGQGGVSDLEELLPVVKRIADTLAVLGIGDMRKLTMDQYDLLAKMVQSGSISDTTLIDIAGRLADIEHRLEAIAKGAVKHRDYANLDEREVAVDSAKDAVLSECRSGLDKVKAAIVEAMSSQWDVSKLPDAVATIRDVQGGLNMVPMARAATLIERCGAFIEERLSQATSTPGEELQILADAIASVDYYIERLSGAHGEELDSYLDLALESLTQLGYAPVTFPESTLEATSLHQPEVENLAHEDAAQVTSIATGQADAANSKSFAQALEDAKAEEANIKEPGTEYEAELGDEESLEAVVVPAPEPGSEGEIDDEIIEIFIEEAGEVQENLAEYFPKWKSDLDNTELLVEVRRAFHTLKGSGRMVEANDVGELSWAVESMLNRVMDASIPPHIAHARLVGLVLDFMPSLITAFKNKAPNPDQDEWNRLAAWATSLASGDIPEGLDGVAPEVVANATAESEPQAPQADDNEDQILWDIFSSEASTHLSVVDTFIADMTQAAPLYSPPSDELQSALHTLKGSAYMAGITPIATMITPLEAFTKELRSYQVKVDRGVLTLLEDAAHLTRVGLACIARKEPVVISEQAAFVERVAAAQSEIVEPLIHAKDDSARVRKVDPKLLSLFMSEEMRLLLDADQRIDDAWRSDTHLFANELPIIQRELKTLCDASSQANLPLMHDLGRQILNVYELIDQGALSADAAVFDVLKLAHEALLDMVDQVAAGQNIVPVNEALQSALESLLAEAAAPSEQVVDSLPTEEFSAQDEPLDETPSTADLDSSAFAVEGEFAGEGFLDSGFSEEEIEEATEAVAAASGASDSDDAEPETFDVAEEVADSEAMRFTSDIDTDVVEVTDPELVDESVGSGVDDASAVPEFAVPEEMAQGGDSDTGQRDEAHIEPYATSVSELLSETPATDESPVANDVAYIDEEDFDPDILEIFIDEAAELIEELDEAIHAWDSNWQDDQAPEVMKRALHTLKGGARLSGVTGLGDLTHDYESYLIATSAPSAEFFQNIHQYQDTLLSAVKAVRARLDGAELTSVEAPAAPPVAVDTQIGDASGSAAGPVSQASNVPAVSDKEKLADAAELAAINQGIKEGATSKRQAPTEMIKVSSDLLEELVNLAGETSISRGRLEQQVSDLSSAVDEVDVTLRRLNEQLRRLDIETDAQVLFRQEQMAAHEQFDPLEMDRYSALQQLTRSLMESSSDLVDLRHTITDKLRDTETMLLQQQRINSSLQEGLMRSRMVPFSRLVPRLRRIVRQVSGELGKHVNFELDNVEGEMDRSVLERMVAPLEHMLRNAVDHGIESPEQRQATGKPEMGRILLSLVREGGDILLRLADDGRGIDLERVREKAIERGLMSADAGLSDHDIMQFILQAGFSTAENVTQISGRGVGMDVVAAEIKQLGGSMTIDSEEGVGTQFVVRLPFTVSVNRALMVQLGQESYAIPLNTIEGIVRVSPFELEHYYSHADARFEYAGENYQVKYLGSMVTRELKPKLDGQLLPLPVILVRSGQQTMALQVDALSGSREIVVKSLGPQFASVQAISGATVMGDGSVVIILDPHALVRYEVALTGVNLTPIENKPPESAQPEPDFRTVMVVDDSVTVRKVTTRFLERQGFNVIVAKDGVDALQVLQESTPDLMLLDIEMPRMDGFEVAKNMRSTQRWKELPIIMITSRTGDKHREHAFSIGVNEYLGKPYQEEALLKAIRSLLEPQAVGA